MVVHPGKPGGKDKRMSTWRVMVLGVLVAMLCLASCSGADSLGGHGGNGGHDDYDMADGVGRDGGVGTWGVSGERGNSSRSWWQSHCSASGQDPKQGKACLIMSHELAGPLLSSWRCDAPIVQANLHPRCFASTIQPLQWSCCPSDMGEEQH